MSKEKLDEAGYSRHSQHPSHLREKLVDTLYLFKGDEFCEAHIEEILSIVDQMKARQQPEDEVISMLLRAYMDANKIPYQTVGDSNIENIMKYLCKRKLMPAHLVPEYLVKKYGLVDNQPSLEEAEKETLRLKKLANEAILARNGNKNEEKGVKSE